MATALLAVLPSAVMISCAQSCALTPCTPACTLQQRHVGSEVNFYQRRLLVISHPVNSKRRRSRAHLEAVLHPSQHVSLHLFTHTHTDERSPSLRATSVAVVTGQTARTNHGFCQPSNHQPALILGGALSKQAARRLILSLKKMKMI